MTTPTTFDKYWNNVSLLLHFNGAVGSTDIVDSSINNFPVVAGFETLVSIAQGGPEPGGGQTPNPGTTYTCLEFNPTSTESAYVAWPITSGGPLDLSSTIGDFTIEAWIEDISAVTIGTSSYTPVQFFGIGGQAGNGSLELIFANNGSGVSPPLFMTWGSQSVEVANAPTLSAGGWLHIAVVRYQGVITVYVNGQSVLTMPDAIATFAPGTEFGFGSGDNAYLAEYRVTKGVARYTSDFTIPAAPFPSSGPPTAVTIPNVIGVDITTATQDLANAGATINQTTQAPSTEPIGTVLAVTPGVGSVSNYPALVSVTLSQGELVPNIIGESLSQAKYDLTQAGFTLGLITYEYDLNVPAAQVTGQSPIGYESVGGPVYLTVSKGPRPAVVPDLSGMDQTTAENAIEAAGLNIGTITTAASSTVPVGEVITQRPGAYSFAAFGSYVRFIISTGPIETAAGFQYEPTIIAQYANSPIMNRLIQNMSAQFDMSKNLKAFYDYIFNVYTAEGFGLDILGRIVNVQREIQVPVSNEFFGFKDSTSPGDWQPLGQAPFRSSAEAVTSTYTLMDPAYRILILVKMMANICDCTAQTLNKLLATLFAGRGKCYVQDNLDMSMTLVFEFPLTNTELAIIGQTGIFPHPSGVSLSIQVNAATDYLGFAEAGGTTAQPFGQGVFYVPPVV